MSTTSAPETFQTGHVGLNVSDLARSQRFYQGVFGLELGDSSQEAGRQFAFLTRDNTLVLTLWQQSEGQFDTARPGLHHLSFQVGSAAEIGAYAARARALGAPFFHDGIVPHGEGADSGGIFFADPDGIRLEIFSPTGAGTGTAPTAGAPTCGFF